VIVFTIITALVLLNGLFVAAEFAIVGTSRASVEHLAANGNRLARRVLGILEDAGRQDRYLATAQVGITVASLGLGMYGEHVLAELIAGWLSPWDDVSWLAVHAIASVIAVTLLTAVHIVIGEMVPKAMALQKAELTALYVTPVMLAIQTAIHPLVVVLNGLGNGLLKLMGVQRQEGGAERYHTTEELQFIIEESRVGGLLRGESGLILKELFEFGDLKAREVMVPRVALISIPVGAAPTDIRQVVRDTPHTRYPLHAGSLDQIIGSVHIKDLLRHLVEERPIAAADARPLPCVPGSAPLDAVLAAMRRDRAQMAVVMDEHGGTAGMVTIEDLFEEVVGEINEGREARLQISIRADGRLHVRGTVRLKDAGDAMSVTLEHPEATSVSGLVLTELGRPPVAGDTVQWGGVRFEVVSVRGKGVAEAVLSSAGQDPAAGPAQPAS